MKPILLIAGCWGMRLERRIFRGYDAKPFSHKFMVSIHYEDLHSCGGTLYKQDTVITAAHCHEEDVHLFDVLVHRHDFQKTDEEERGSRYKIKEFITHPDYRLRGVKNDIAIVRLYRRGHARTRVILDDAGISEMEGTELTLLGWGLNEHGEYPDILQETKLPILDIGYCKERYATLGHSINETMVLCAGFEKAQSDSCNADSGGPLFLISNNHVVLVGIVSWGEGCAVDGFPGFYTRVSSYIPWILATV